MFGVQWVKTRTPCSCRKRCWLPLRLAPVAGSLSPAPARDTTQIHWEDLNCTEPVVTKRGLKQGCPLSPLQLMQYMERLERKLEDIKIGFSRCYSCKGQEVEQCIPELIYADDIVLPEDFTWWVIHLVGSSCIRKHLTMHVC